MRKKCPQAAMVKRQGGPQMSSVNGRGDTLSPADTQLEGNTVVYMENFLAIPPIKRNGWSARHKGS